MKKISFEHIQHIPEGPTPRNAKEDLINQIIEQCYFKTEAEKSTARRRLAIACHTAKWTTTDLHALLKKRNDPSIRNYTALVLWHCRITKARIK